MTGTEPAGARPMRPNETIRASGTVTAATRHMATIFPTVIPSNPYARWATYPTMAKRNPLTMRAWRMFRRSENTLREIRRVAPLYRL